jgi:hypothetical protein
MSVGHLKTANEQTVDRHVSADNSHTLRIITEDMRHEDQQRNVCSGDHPVPYNAS